MNTQIHASVPVIEVIGLPGAGKSSLIARLSQEPRHENEMPVILPPYDPGALATVAVLLRLICIGILRAPIQLIRFGMTSNSLWLLSKLAYRTAALRQRKLEPGAILCDSGTLQPFISYPAEFRKQSHGSIPLSVLLQLVPWPSAIMYVRVPPSTALERYRQRQSSTSRRPDAQVNPEGFALAQQTCEQIVAQCEQSATRLLIVDNKETLERDFLCAVRGELAKLSREIAKEHP